MKTLSSHFAAAFCLLAAAFAAPDAMAKPIECTSRSSQVTAVTETDAIWINAKFQETYLTTGQAQLQPVLAVKISNTDPGCLVAHLSGLAGITDNYIVFQLRVDGKPVEGGQQLTGAANPDTPVASVSLDEGTAPYNDEQFSDPLKTVSYNFFGKLSGGVHYVEVLTAAGSNIDPNNRPYLRNLTLTLEHP